MFQRILLFISIKSKGSPILTFSKSSLVISAGNASALEQPHLHFVLSFEPNGWTGALKALLAPPN